jgi:hypothetical protein
VIVLQECLEKAQENNLHSGLVPHLIPDGVVILQYADGTIILFQDDMNMAINVKILLYLYENLAGLKINFDKSKILLSIEDSIKLELYADNLNCQMGFWPIKFLGALVSGGD